MIIRFLIILLIFSTLNLSCDSDVPEFDGQKAFQNLLDQFIKQNATHWCFEDDSRKFTSALDLLSFSNKKASVLMRTALESVVATAENNEGADIDELKVSEVYVNEGMTMKRIRPRAKGRADRIFKRSSHITVTVSDN